MKGLKAIFTGRVKKINGFTLTQSGLSYEKMLEKAKEVAHTINCKANGKEADKASGHLVLIRHDGKTIALAVIAERATQKELKEMSPSLMLAPKAPKTSKIIHGDFTVEEEKVSAAAY